MAKKMTLDELKARNEKLSASLADINEDLQKKQHALNIIQKQIADEERKVRTHNLCQVGGLAYKYFGDDMTPDEFKELLDFVFSVSEVQEFVNSEKEKRALRDKPTAVQEIPSSVKDNRTTKHDLKESA